MILHGQKKRVLKEIVKYFVDTTGSSYEDFILNVQKARGKVEPDQDYAVWLAVNSYALLSQHGITLSDCIENKDVIRATIKEDESRMGGEFYTPEVWCVDGRNYLKEMLGDLWGKAYIWDASAGTGNLLKTSDYPRDRIFLSTLLEEDVQMLEGVMPGATVFQSDFVQGLDTDENNMHFSRHLPERLQEILRNDEPLVLFMNPPYKVQVATNSDVGVLMSTQGMRKCALDIFHQFMYRIVLLKRTYNLKNLYAGIYGPITMFHSKMIEPLYLEYKKEFKFVDGMCFDAGDFSSTSESVGWIVGYTTWRVKEEGEEDSRIMLTAKEKVEDSPQGWHTTGTRLITDVEVNLHPWAFPLDVVRYEMEPEITGFSDEARGMVKSPENAMGHMMSSNYVIRATRRAAVTTLPTPDNIPITTENFWRCVGSFAARRAYAVQSTPFNNCQYYSKPETKSEGYSRWIVDALAVFLFDSSSLFASYRGLKLATGSKTEYFDKQNFMFPLSMDAVRTLVTDAEILDDMHNYPAKNQFILGILEKYVPHMGPEARELYDLGISMLQESLKGDRRSKAGYDKFTRAWDAGLIQIRTAPGLIDKDQLDAYSLALSKLKHKLNEGIYKYGFLMDTAFEVEDEMSSMMDVDGDGDNEVDEESSLTMAN